MIPALMRSDVPACCRPTSLDDPTSRDHSAHIFVSALELTSDDAYVPAISEPHEQLQWHRSGGIQS
jgi:hypothetical protein